MDNDRYYQLGSYDKLFNQIDELTDALASRDLEVAELTRKLDYWRDKAKERDKLRKDVEMLRDALEWVRDNVTYSKPMNTRIDEALAAMEPKP